MGKIAQSRDGDDFSKHNYFQKRFTENVRLNLNDLMKKRDAEKKIVRKTNVLIVSGAIAAISVVFIILSL